VTKRFFAARFTVVAIGIVVTLLAAYAGTSTAGSAGVQVAAAVPGSNLGNAPGVTAKTIKFAVMTQIKDCGATKVDPATVAGTKERFNTLVKWVNQHIKLPGGRKLAVEFVDDGGSDVGCVDVARAGIQQAVDQDHVFAVLKDTYNPAINVPDIIAKKKTIIIGWNFQTYHDLASHFPYGWSVYEPAELSLQELTWMIRKRFTKRQYVADNGTKHQRVWGALFGDTTLGHALSNLTKKHMATGKLALKQYYISPDPTTAGQQASGIALQMQQAGVNSIIYGADALGPDISFNTAAANAGYHPDFFISQYGSLPQLTVFVPYFGAEFGKRLYGTGPPLIVGERVEVDSTGAVTQKISPSVYGQNNGYNKASLTAYMQAGGSAGNHPGVGAWGFGTFIWPDLMTLVLGAANAGPVLNAKTFAWGLQHGPKTACMTQQFFGKQPYAQGAKFSFHNPPRNWLQSGFTTLYFNPAKKNTYGTNGVFESYDNYQLFNSLDALPGSPKYDTGAAGDYKLIKQTGKYSVDMHC
jgi:hypothetical protein